MGGIGNVDWRPMKGKIVKSGKMKAKLNYLYFLSFFSIVLL